MIFRRLLLFIFVFLAVGCTKKINNNGLSVTTVIKNPINLDFNRNFGNKIYFQFINSSKVTGFTDFPSLVINTLSKKGYHFLQNIQGSDYIVRFRIINISKMSYSNGRKDSYILNSMITIQQNIDGIYVPHSSQVISKVNNFSGNNLEEVFNLLELNILNSLRQIF